MNAPRKAPRWLVTASGPGNVALMIWAAACAVAQEPEMFGPVGSGGSSPGSGGIAPSGGQRPGGSGGVTSTRTGGRQATAGGSGGSSAGKSSSGSGGSITTKGGTGNGGASRGGTGNGGASRGGTGNGGASRGGTSGGAASTSFSDDFEDGNSLGWTVHDGNWSVPLDGLARVFEGTPNSAYARASAGSSSWTNQSVEARIKPVAWTGTNTNRFAVLAARFVDIDNYYYLAIREDQTIEIKKIVNSSASTVAAAVPVKFAIGTWYKVKFEAVGTSLKAYVNDVSVLSGTASDIPAGKICVGAFNGTVSFDDIVVK